MIRVEKIESSIDKSRYKLSLGLYSNEALSIMEKTMEFVDCNMYFENDKIDRYVRRDEDGELYLVGIYKFTETASMHKWRRSHNWKNAPLNNFLCSANVPFSFPCNGDANKLMICDNCSTYSFCYGSLYIDRLMYRMSRMLYLESYKHLPKEFLDKIDTLIEGWHGNVEDEFKRLVGTQLDPFKLSAMKTLYADMSNMIKDGNVISDKKDEFYKELNEYNILKGSSI